MDVVELLLIVGTAGRLTRLAMVDDAGVIIRTPILWSARTVAKERGVDVAVRLLSCPWCIGFWLSLATAGSWAVAGHTIVWQAGAAAFTASWVAGIMMGASDGTPS